MRVLPKVVILAMVIAGCGGTSPDAPSILSNPVAGLDPVGSISVGDGPQDIVVAEDGELGLTVNIFANSLTLFDPAARRVIAEVALSSQVRAAAISPDHRFAHVVHGSELSVVDLRVRRVVRRVSVGGRPVDLVLDDSRKVAILLNATHLQPELQFVNLEDGLIQPRAIDADPRSLALDPGSELVYITHGESGQLSVVDPRTGETRFRIPAGPAPRHLALSPDGLRAYVCNIDHDQLSIIHLGERRVEGSVAVGSRPFDVALTPDGAAAFVVNSADNSLTLVDLERRVPVTTVAVGQSPHAVAVNQARGEVYVANRGSNTVTILRMIREESRATLDLGL